MNHSTPKTISLSSSINLRNMISLADMAPSLPKKRTSSRISLLIAKSLANKQRNEFGISTEDNLSTEEDYSSLNSSLCSNSIYINMNLFFSLDEWKSISKVEVNINEAFTIDSLISCAIDNINSEEKRINSNSNCYEIRFAKKNGHPKFDYPPLSIDSKIKDYMKYNLCLVWKGDDDKEERYTLPLKEKVKSRSKSTDEIKESNELISNKCLIF